MRLLLSLLIAGFPAMGQASAPQASADPAVVRVTARLVQINVVVHDKKYEPTYDQTIRSGLYVEQDVALPAVACQLKVAVRDLTSGNVSTVNIPTSALKELTQAQPSPAVKQR